MSDPLRFGLPAGARELIERRQRHAKRFVLPDGRVVVVCQRDLHYDDGGVLRDTDLTFRVDGARQVSDHHPRNAVRITRFGLSLTDRATGKGVTWYLPSAAQAAGRRATAQLGGMEWTWTRVRAGIKGEAIVTSPLGKRVATFRLAAVGGETLAVTEGGDIAGEATVIPRVSIRGADGREYPAGPWVWDGQQASVELDDTLFPASAYPYVVDPSTYSATASGDDGYTSQGGSSFPPSGSTTVNTSADTFMANVQYASPFYRCRAAFARMDTSGIGDSDVISSAVLRLYVTEVTNVDSRTLYGDYYATANWPIDGADHVDTMSSGSAFGLALSAISAGAYNEFALTSPDSNISKTGYTGFRMGITGGSPSGVNSVTFASYDHATYDEPQLIVTIGQDATATPSGVASTAARGTVAAAAGAAAAVTGRAAAAAVGAPVAGASASVSVIGQALAAAVGAVAIAASAFVAAAGVAAAAGVGAATAAAAASASAIGQGAAAGHGTVAASGAALASVAGQAGSAAVGSPAAGVSVAPAPAGLAAIAAPGVVIVAGTAAAPVSGQAGAAALGSVAVSVGGDVEVPAQGIAAAAAIGSVFPAAAANVSPAGRAAAAGVGAVSASAAAAVPVGGQAATAAVGAVGIEAHTDATVVITTPGLSGSLGAVTASASATVPVAGAGAAAQLGAPVAYGLTSVRTGRRLLRVAADSRTVVVPRDGRVLVPQDCRRDVVPRVVRCVAVAVAARKVRGE